MWDKARHQILERFFEELKDLIKALMEKLMLEERELYRESHPTKGNGYYTRDLLTQCGVLSDLRVPRVRQGNFHPKLIPCRRRISLELSEAILALYASGASTRDISRFLASVHGAFYSPQSISRFTQVVEEVRECKSRSLAQAYYAICLDCTFLAVRQGKATKEPVYVALGTRPDGRAGSAGVLAVWGGRGVGPKLAAGGERTEGPGGQGGEGFHQRRAAWDRGCGAGDLPRGQVATVCAAHGEGLPGQGEEGRPGGPSPGSQGGVRGGHS